MRILYISGSMGLGHVNRDLAIASALRSRRDGVDIRWLAGEPAASVLREAGEHLHPLVGDYRSDTTVAERVSKAGEMSLLTYAFAAQHEWLANALLVRRLLRHETYDIVVGDETYELMSAEIFGLLRISSPFIMMYDFVGLDAMTERWAERVGVYFWNFVWSRDRRVLTSGRNQGIFIGEPDDVPEKPFGLLLPHRRQHAERFYRFVGYILPFDPGQFRDRARVRRELGYDGRPLVVCAVGGMSVGRDLLGLCAQAYEVAAGHIPDLRMVLVCGPRIPPESLRASPGVDVQGYVTHLYKHFAASDLAIVQSGGTTTLELTALQRPFIYFPIEGQCEQEITIADRLARQRAGTPMRLSTTTAADLAKAIVDNIHAPVSYLPPPVDGADRAAQIILGAQGRTPMNRESASARRG